MNQINELVNETKNLTKYHNINFAVNCPVSVVQRRFVRATAVWYSVSLRLLVCKCVAESNLIPT